MPKLAQFTMVSSDTGRTEKTEIVIGAAHVVLVKPAANDHSILILTGGIELKVASTVEQAFHKLIG